MFRHLLIIYQHHYRSLKGIQMNWTPIDTPKSQVHRICAPEQIMLNKYFVKKTQNHKVVVTLGEKVAEKLRWLPKDKLIVVQNGQKLGLTLGEKGYTLTAPKSKKDSRVPVRSVVRISLDEQIIEEIFGTKKNLVFKPSIDQRVLIIKEPNAS